MYRLNYAMKTDYKNSNDIIAVKNGNENTRNFIIHS